MSKHGPDAKRYRKQNATARAEMKGRSARTSLWFYLWAVWMPLTCLLPCGFAAAIPNDAIRTGFAMAAFFLPLVGLGGMVLMWSDYWKWQHLHRLVDLADELGMRFAERADRDLLGWLKTLGIHRDASHLEAGKSLQGEVEGVPVSLLEVSFAVGHGRHASVYTQTAVVVQELPGDLPHFAVCPKN